LIHRPALCEAPNYIAEELLRAEGFTEVQYVKRVEGPAVDALAAGEADISMIFGPPIILRIDSGDPLVFLSGVHVGCAEVIANDRVRTFRDLKGKRVAITAMRDAYHVFVASIAAHVGLRPETDIQWLTPPFAEWTRLLAEGQVDALFVGPPQVQELRARKIGHSIVNMLTDRPWSQYYCCMLVGHRDFVQRYPVATKRAMRAILKAADICSREPEKVVRFLVDKAMPSGPTMPSMR
jgi:NitT/TauT family transport system substrate-binding protein